MISILASKLPADQQDRARRTGLIARAANGAGGRMAMDRLPSPGQWGMVGDAAATPRGRDATGTAP